MKKGMKNVLYPNQRTKAREDQIKNDAGGFVFDVGAEQYFKRFLIIGTFGGNYYVTENVLTSRAIISAKKFIEDNPKKAVDIIAGVSVSGENIYQEPVLYSFALACCLKNKEDRVYAISHFNKVVRTLSQLSMFTAYIKTMRGFGRALRKAYSRWFYMKAPNKISFQIAKYRSRNGWSFRDIARVSHINRIDGYRNAPKDLAVWGKEEYDAIFDYAKNGFNDNVLFGALETKRQLQLCKTPQEVLDICKSRKVVEQFLPTEFRNNVDICREIVPILGYNALLRNLGRYTKMGVFASDEALYYAVDSITNKEKIARSRIHPAKIFLAWKVYESGSGRRIGWIPNRELSKALEKAVYLSIDTKQPSGKKRLIALDVSGSMTFTSSESDSFRDNFTMKEFGAFLMYLAMMSENAGNIDLLAFNINYLKLSKFTDVDFDEFYKNNNLHRLSGGTDCSAPLQFAIRERKKYDSIEIITDNETWAGSSHPYMMMQKYRKEFNNKAKLSIVALDGNRYTIGDINDPLTLQVIGFSPNVLDMIDKFIKE